MPLRPLILIADDESRIRRFVAEELERVGFDVCQAQDGEQALAVFSHATIPPDVVVLDLMMPGMDGLEVLRALRKTSTVPVLMLTARDYLSDKRLAFEAGVDDYLVKPFAMEELVMRVQALLRRAAAEPQGRASESERIVNGPLTLIPAESTALWRGERLALTKLEYDLLEVLVRRPASVIAYERLLAVGWPQDTSGDTSRLRVAMTRVRKKLAAAGANPKVLSSLMNVGYILGDLSHYDEDYGDDEN